MKTCEICESEFEINIDGSGGRSRLICYNCMPSGLSRTEIAKIKRSLYLNKSRVEKEKIGCQICGYNKFGVALDWHHPNSDKDLNPSQILNHGSYSSYLEETKKCVLLCACCHRAVHSGHLNI